jgi:SNF2 family DNA or RNA helicase
MEDRLRLYDYQDAGVHFLMNRDRAYLADVPGLGKTAQALIAAKVKGLSPLVIAPAVAIPVWQDEARKWGVELADVVSYSKLARDPYPWQASMLPSTVVVLDEAHYTKSPKAKRTKAALTLARQASHAWLLSGSPMPNDPTELWTVFTALWPERIPSYAKSFEAWRNHFTSWSYVDYGHGRRVVKVWGTKNGLELREMVRGVMLRRHLADVNLQLPSLRLNVVPLPADADLDRELELQPDTLQTPEVRRILGEHKAAPISDVLINEQHRAVVVMYHHKNTGAYLRQKLEAGGYVVYGFDGSTPSHTRGEQVEAFQKGTFRAAFVVQQQAGGVAITLTRASEIVLVEPDWSPEVNAQAIKRVHRIGQTNPVRARLFKVEGSLDEGIMEGLARKIAMRKEILS